MSNFLKKDEMKALLHEAIEALVPLSSVHFSKDHHSPATWNHEEIRMLGESLRTRKNPEKFHSGSDEGLDRVAIFKAALGLGFVSMSCTRSKNEIEKRLGIFSESTYLDEPVDAVVVFGAAGLSPLKRVCYACDNINMLRVRTNQLIVVTCERETTKAERDALDNAGFTAYGTEFGLCKEAVRVMTGCSLKDGATIPVTYGQRQLQARTATGVWTFRSTCCRPEETCCKCDKQGGQCNEDGCMVDRRLDISVMVVSAPFDPDRILENGKLATRANTEEVLAPLQALLGNKVKRLFVVSHDIWQKNQELIAQRCFPDTEVIGTGPQDSGRIILDDDLRATLNRSSDVQDELAKYILCLDRLVSESESKAK